MAYGSSLVASTRPGCCKVAEALRYVCTGCDPSKFMPRPLRAFAFHAVCPRSLRIDVFQLYVVVVVDEGSIPDHQWWMEEVPSTTFLPGASLLVGRDQSLSCRKMRLYIAGIIALGTRLLHSIGDRLTEVLVWSFEFIRPICRKGSRRPSNSTL
jgi:hypothetical protein